MGGGGGLWDVGGLGGNVGCWGGGCWGMWGDVGIWVGEWGRGKSWVFILFSGERERDAVGKNEWGVSFRKREGGGRDYENFDVC